uniref:Reverse transcriptase domain-containing protein n=1 Tax=Tanacetum cinerariifolium TaxID=118510 RepID=A0A699JJT2_TANCI|nr:reverse transcriptase domain-containing protein [Tanacetum cinerariifolium]
MTDQGVTATLAAGDALRSTNGDDSHNSGTGVKRTERAARECTCTDFLKCQPLPFKGTEGTVGHEAAYGMSWKTLMKMMTDKYCPRNEIGKLEVELWELKVKGTDLASYTQRFQELALLCGRMFFEESDKIEKYVGGLPDTIHGSVVASKPKTMQEAIEIATELMDKKIRTFAERKTASKRKFENTSRNTQNQQQQHSNKRQNTGRVYTAAPSEKKQYGGSRPRCAKCNYHHDGPCTPKCRNCNKIGHSTVGHEAAYGMSWKTLMKMMTDKYCPRNEIGKQEVELWELKVKGTDLASYTQRFQDLALLCGRMFFEESDKIEKYVGGLPDMIHGSVVASKPKTMQEGIEIATELMDKKIHTFAERETASKRKFENTSRNTHSEPTTTTLEQEAEHRSSVHRST